MATKYTIPTAFTRRFIDNDFDDPVAMATLNGTLLAGLNAEPVDNSGPLTHWVCRVMLGQRDLSRTDAITALTSTPIAPRDHDPFYQFISDMISTGNTINRGPSVSTMVVENGDDISWVDSARCALLASVGGLVEGLLIVGRIADRTAEVPEGLPGRTYPEVDGEGEPTGVDLIHTWESWATANGCVFLVKNDVDYLPLKRNETYLTSAEWLPLHLAGSLTVLTQGEYQAIEVVEPV